LRGIPLKPPNSYAENKETSIFSKKKIAFFQARANELNENSDGNFASFIYISHYIEPGGCPRI